MNFLLLSARVRNRTDISTIWHTYFLCVCVLLNLLIKLKIKNEDYKLTPTRRQRELQVNDIPLKKRVAFP